MYVIVCVYVYARMHRCVCNIYMCMCMCTHLHDSRICTCVCICNLQCLRRCVCVCLCDVEVLARVDHSDSAIFPYAHGSYSLGSLRKGGPVFALSSGDGLLHGVPPKDRQKGKHRTQSIRQRALAPKARPRQEIDIDQISLT